MAWYKPYHLCVCLEDDSILASGLIATEMPNAC